MPTKIFTMTHKKYTEQKDPAYTTLHVGRAGKADLGYQGDDTGDNISLANCYYSELTGMYWVWKNYQGTENIGICHYRRFFINDAWEILTEKEYDDILSQYDIITSKAMYTSEKSYWDYYGKVQNIKDLQAEAEVIKKLYPKDYPAFCKVMEGKKHYFGNLMVTSRKLYDEYCEWLFTIFFALEEKLDVSTYDDYHKRVFGFLSEQLLLVWITARGLNAYECPVGISEEKAETKELKLAVGQLLKMNRTIEAKQLFYEVLKVRPDVELPDSDLSDEIPIIGKLLNICELEIKNGEPGMLSYSNDLNELLKHYAKICEILNGKVLSDEDRKYLKDTNVSDIAKKVIL